MAQARWVRADGKRPVMVSGAAASTTNPATWSTFADVQSGAGDGFGVMLGEGLGCWDLDNCLHNGSLTDWAVNALEAIEFPVLFIEVSFSGSGLHVFVEAGEQPGRVVRVSGGGTVEKYYRQRFIRTTLKEFAHK